MIRAAARMLARVARLRVHTVEHAVVHGRIQWAVMSRHWLGIVRRFEGARSNRLEAVQLRRRLRAAQWQ